MFLINIRIKEMINSIIKERLSALSLQAFEDLIQLPSQSSEDIVLHGKKITLSVWHDVLESQDHRIVVQVYKGWIFSIGRMYVDGFVVNSRNEKRALTLEERYPFT